jgi:hypothetical protein
MEFNIGDKVWIRDYVDPDSFVGIGVVVGARFSHTFNRFIYTVRESKEIGQYFNEYLASREVVV